MNKKDKRIFEAMRYVSEENDFCCLALTNYEAKNGVDFSLRKKFINFFQEQKEDDSGGWFGQTNKKENQNTRLTALALFMVAEKDVV